MTSASALPLGSHSKYNEIHHRSNGRWERGPAALQAAGETPDLFLRAADLPSRRSSWRDAQGLGLKLGPPFRELQVHALTP